MKTLRHHLRDKIVMAGVFFALFGLGFTFMSSSITDIYYSRNDGDYFLNVQSIETVDPVVSTASIEPYALDETVKINFCREPRTLILAERNIRTFYLMEDGTEQSVLQRQLPAGILYEVTPTGCDVINLLPAFRPNVAGSYRFCQSLDFTISSNGKSYQKDASFCSDSYELKDL